MIIPEPVATRLPCRWFGHRWSKWLRYDAWPVARHVYESGTLCFCTRKRCDEALFRDVEWWPISPSAYSQWYDDR